MVSNITKNASSSDHRPLCRLRIDHSFEPLLCKSHACKQVSPSLILPIRIPRPDIGEPRILTLYLAMLIILLVSAILALDRFDKLGESRPPSNLVSRLYLSDPLESKYKFHAQSLTGSLLLVDHRQI